MNQKKNIYPSRKIRGISFFTTDQAVKVGQRWYVSSKNLDKFLSGKE